MGKKTIGDELKEAHKEHGKEAFSKKTEPMRYALQGLEMLVEALAFAIASGYAIYSGWHNDLPKWGADVLLVAGALIAIRAFIEFVKVLNRRG